MNLFVLICKVSHEAEALSASVAAKEPLGTSPTPNQGVIVEICCPFFTCRLMKERA